MYYISIPFTTDGSGNFNTTIPKGGNPQETLIYEVGFNGGNLTGGTAVLTQTNTPYGFNITLLNLAAANVTKVFLPRVAEQDTSGVDGSGKLLQSLVGDLNLVLSGAGANKSGKVVITVI